MRTFTAPIKNEIKKLCNDFASFYEQPKGLKEISTNRSVIADYLKEVVIKVSSDKQIVASPKDAIPVFQQQILNAVYSRFHNVLYYIACLLQADLLDRELAASRQLAKDQFLRSADAIAILMLKWHPDQFCSSYGVKRSKKFVLISYYNALLKQQEIYSFETFRFIQHLAEFGHSCWWNKKETPTYEDTFDLTGAGKKVIKKVL